MNKVLTFLKKLLGFGKDVVAEVQEAVEDVKELAEKHDVTLPDLGLKKEEPTEPKREVKPRAKRAPKKKEEAPATTDGEEPTPKQKTTARKPRAKKVSKDA